DARAQLTSRTTVSVKQVVQEPAVAERREPLLVGIVLPRPQRRRRGAGRRGHERPGHRTHAGAAPAETDLAVVAAATAAVTSLVGAETLEEPCVLLVPRGRQADIREHVAQFGRPGSTGLRTRGALPAAEGAEPRPDVLSADVLQQAILRQHPTQAFAD